jgi:hypothetical protein
MTNSDNESLFPTTLKEESILKEDDKEKRQLIKNNPHAIHRVTRSDNKACGKIYHTNL